MHVGVGLPAGIPGTTGDQLTEWATAADAGPYGSVCVIDRLVFDCYDPLIALAAAAAVTRRVQLATTILISPMRHTTLLGKQLASLVRLSGERLVLGVGVGARHEDWAAAGLDPTARGRQLSRQVLDIADLFESPESPIAVMGAGRPTVLIGGASDSAFVRMSRSADGYIHGGGPPRAFARAADRARAAWSDAGRPGAPALWGQAYFAFGAAEPAGRRYMREYYAFTGPFAEKFAAGMLSSEQQVLELLRGYEEAGCDSLCLLPAVAELDQLKQLTEVVARYQAEPA